MLSRKTNMHTALPIVNGAGAAYGPVRSRTSGDRKATATRDSRIHRNPASSWIRPDAKVQVPTKIDRIAPSGTLAQIMLFSLCPDKLVGLSGKMDRRTLPAIWLKKIPEAACFRTVFTVTSDLNMEALAAADPQIIIDIGEKKDTIVQDMDSIPAATRHPCRLHRGQAWTKRRPAIRR